MLSRTISSLGNFAIIHKNKFETADTESTRHRSIIKNLREHKITKRHKLPLLDKSSGADKLADMTGTSQALLTATTVFPFVVFPDTLNIDRNKLTVVHRSFFRVASIISVQIDDVQLVKVDVGPFFGAVHLASKYFVDNIQSIKFLRRDDAIQIQRLLQGYMIAHQKQIDCSKIGNSQLVTLLTELGQGASN